MNELAEEQIRRAIQLRILLRDVDLELAKLRPRTNLTRGGSAGKRPGPSRPPLRELIQYGPLLANGMFYSRGKDKITGRTYECCPTCGQRVRNGVLAN